MSDPTPQPSSQVLESLRHLPSVEELASKIANHPHQIGISAARLEVEQARQRILAGEDPPPRDVLQRATANRAEDLAGASLRRVINATGVVLHTNLGRAPLAEKAIEHLAEVARGYSNLEFDLDSGERGTRTSHVEPLLCELSGAEAALAVNNNAAAVTLALAATAAGLEVVVSRGQLVEIGGSFRIPEILEQSGAKLVEVGTTNRTRLADYERAIGSDTGAILRVHQSNFRTVGFTEEVELGELAALAQAHKVALIDDLGSGALGRLKTSRACPIVSPPVLIWSAARRTSSSVVRRPGSSWGKQKPLTPADTTRLLGHSGSTNSSLPR